MFGPREKCAVARAIVERRSYCSGYLILEALGWPSILQRLKQRCHTGKAMLGIAEQKTTSTSAPIDRDAQLYAIKWDSHVG